MGGSESSQNHKKNDDSAGHLHGDDASETVKLSGGAIVAGVLLAGLAIAVLSGSRSKFKRKTMKAPRRSTCIFRDDFEVDPASYFRDLRK